MIVSISIRSNCLLFSLLVKRKLKSRFFVRICYSEFHFYNEIYFDGLFYRVDFLDRSKFGIWLYKKSPFLHFLYSFFPFRGKIIVTRYKII